jgi:hypothetical protein
LSWPFAPTAANIYFEKDPLRINSRVFKNIPGHRSYFSRSARFERPRFSHSLGTSGRYLSAMVNLPAMLQSGIYNKIR